MVAFDVDDMYSSHSAWVIAHSEQALDHRATVRVDLTRHRVEIEPTWSGVEELRETIRRAGYTPTTGKSSGEAFSLAVANVVTLESIEFELPEVVEGERQIGV